MRMPQLVSIAPRTGVRLSMRFAMVVAVYTLRRACVRALTTGALPSGPWCSGGWARVGPA
eukprot:5824944-Alexandrium_andersonii.AAC.1